MFENIRPRLLNRKDTAVNPDELLDNEVDQYLINVGMQLIARGDGDQVASVKIETEPETDSTVARVTGTKKAK